LAVKAFSKNGRRLIVVGDGPDRQHIQSLAASNVEFKGRVSREEVRSYMMNAYAVVFPGFEDFGITPVEANACGKPVLAFGAGGALESIISGKTGLFFSAQEPDSVNEALLKFEQIDWNAELCAENARRFSEERFAEEMSSFVGRVVNGE
jgi:glycosyltransferase involved in cell wall biosynthesis